MHSGPWLGGGCLILRHQPILRSRKALYSGRLVIRVEPLDYPMFTERIDAMVSRGFFQSVSYLVLSSASFLIFVILIFVLISFSFLTLPLQEGAGLDEDEWETSAWKNRLHQLCSETGEPRSNPERLHPVNWSYADVTISYLLSWGLLEPCSNCIDSWKSLDTYAFLE